MMRQVALVWLLGCGPRTPPPGAPGQSIHDAMVLVCETPTRAEADSEYAGHESDVIAKHLTDGVGNNDVLLTVEAWKTDGIKRGELLQLMKRAGIKRCRLYEVTQ